MVWHSSKSEVKVKLNAIGYDCGEMSRAAQSALFVSAQPRSLSFSPVALAVHTTIARTANSRRRSILSIICGPTEALVGF